MLIAKLVIFNFLALCGLIAATLAGFVIPAFQADLSYVSYAIVAMFVYGLFQIFRFALIDVDKETLIKYGHVTDINGYLTALGILGTAVGVLISLGGASVGSDASAVRDFATVVLGGTKVAFHSTIVGMVAWLWFNVNWRMVYTRIKLNVA